MAPVAANATNVSRKPPMPARRVAQATDNQDAVPKTTSASHPGPAYVRERKNSITESVAESTATVTSTASSKTLRASFLQEKIDVVCRGCHELLLATAPNALGALEEEKGFYQKAVVNMFREVFDKAENGLLRRVEEAQATVAVAEREMEVRTSAKASAENELQKKKTEIESKNEIFTKDAGALQEKDALLQIAVEKKTQAKQQYNALAAECEGTVTAQQDSLNVLKEGTWTNAREHKKHIGNLVSLFKKLGADASLVSALPSALEKKPADRGTFDGMVVVQLEEILAKHVAAVQEDMTRAAHRMQRTNDEVDAAVALAEEAREKYKKSSEIAAQAQAEWKGVEANLRNAIWAAKEQQRALKQTGVDLLEEKSGLERINGAKMTLAALAGGCADLPDGQSVSEERSSLKSMHKPDCAAAPTRERAVPACRDRAPFAPDDRKVPSRTRSGSQPASPPGSHPSSCPVSPGQGNFS